MSLQVSPKHPVAYFCAEYGLEANLPWYAGGLGVLAGDTVKQASDSALPFIGIGLLYRGDKMVQEISPEGEQSEKDFVYDPVAAGLEHVYLQDEPLFVKVHLTVRDVWLRCWKKTFANGVVLYLLDADTDQNEPEERDLTRKLYFGSDEEQLQQQLLLGIGGVKLIKKLGITPAVYHINEGKPAFLHWQLIRSLMDTHKIDYTAARQLAVNCTVYTNHTLVPAGNKFYPADLVKQYADYYASKMNISVDRLLMPGLDEAGSTFSVTDFALNSSRKANGVSEYHSRLSQENWPSYHWVNVTNGVHLPTWQDSEMPKFVAMPDSLWHRHQELKAKTEEFVRSRTGYGYDSRQLVIGWARRLAGYKQLHIIFSDLARLKSILHHAEKPVKLLISGKAHQGDTAGKELLQKVIGYLQNDLAGQALYIPNYDIEIAKHMTSGVDVWLNTPELGKEACGTSGMKAIANGVLQLSVPDGWLAEVDYTAFGWKLDHENTDESIYYLLENEVVPLFYQRDNDGLPAEWIKKMVAAIHKSQHFCTKRMLEEYKNLLYSA